jgi:hypothetical protein
MNAITKWQEEGYRRLLINEDLYIARRTYCRRRMDYNGEARAFAVYEAGRAAILAAVRAQDPLLLTQDKAA